MLQRTNAARPIWKNEAEEALRNLLTNSPVSIDM